MSKINVILLINLLNPSLILMLNGINVKYKLNEYVIDTCCSFNENDRIYLSCGENELIHLNIIEIYYNSNSYCSSELYCCKYRTKCSRRITKYSNLNCDEKNSCWIDKSCLKIYEPCSSISGLYGQYITINYSCLSINQTNLIDDYQPVPFIVKLLTSEQTTNKNSFIKKNLFLLNHFKSSPIFLILISISFIFFMLFIYWLANQFGNKFCRNKSFTKNVKTNTIETNILYQYTNDSKTNVQSNPSLTINRIYPSIPIYRYYHHYNTNKYNPYQRYINVEHDKNNGLIYSRTFNPNFNYYNN